VGNLLKTCENDKLDRFRGVDTHIISLTHNIKEGSYTAALRRKSAQVTEDISQNVTDTKKQTQARTIIVLSYVDNINKLSVFRGSEQMNSQDELKEMFLYQSINQSINQAVVMTRYFENSC